MHTNEQSVYGDYRLNIYRHSGYLTQRLIVNVFSPPFFCRRLWCVACASHSSCALSPALVVVLECVYNFMSVLNRCIPFHFVSTVYRRLLSHAHTKLSFALFIRCDTMANLSVSLTSIGRTFCRCRCHRCCCSSYSFE